MGFVSSPSHRRKRPQPRAEPRVEDIGILLPAFTFWGFYTAVSFFAAIPHRHTVSPPDLAADAPVLQATHPVIIDLCPAVGVELHGSVCHDFLTFFHTRIFEEPLLTQTRLDGHIGTLGVADVVLMWLLFDHGAHFGEQLDRFLSAFKAVQASQVFAGKLIQHTVWM